MSVATMLESMFSLAGQTSLVTGAGGGIGAELCRGLAAAGGRAFVHRLDVLDADDIAACVNILW